MKMRGNLKSAKGIKRLPGKKRKKDKERANFLTNSLAKVINKLIDPSQTGAGPNKVIFDHLFSINSILEYMDVNELDSLLISFDQEKAFDRVEHLFITEVLKAYQQHSIRCI